jgi:hypothetical protein
MTCLDTADIKDKLPFYFLHHCHLFLIFKQAQEQYHLPRLEIPMLPCSHRHLLCHLFNIRLDMLNDIQIKLPILSTTLREYLHLSDLPGGTAQYA